MLAVSSLALLFGGAPAAHADFVPVNSAPQTSPAERALLQTFSCEPPTAESARDDAGVSSCHSSDAPARALPDVPPPDTYTPVTGFSGVPAPRGSGSGFGGTFSGGQGTGHGSATAAPAFHTTLLTSDEVAGCLALEQASKRPPAFPSRLFRPPRQA
jgi:hypothetical protein